jgi:S-ribosylhomocysteine lyase
MEKIVSFQVDHEHLKRGIYVSRKDVDNRTGEVIATTIDIRLKEPNREPVLNNAELHTMEHLGATFLRNDPVYKQETIYFGPMGCRTGFYAIFKGDLSSRDVVGILTDMFLFIARYEGEIPGADARSCGNYLDQNLPMAKYEAQKFYREVLSFMTDENLFYPQPTSASHC